MASVVALVPPAAATARASCTTNAEHLTMAFSSAAAGAASGLAQTTRPQARQWCFRLPMPNALLQSGHDATSSSGCHGTSACSNARCWEVVRIVVRKRECGAKEDIMEEEKELRGTAAGIDSSGNDAAGSCMASSCHGGKRRAGDGETRIDGQIATDPVCTHLFNSPSYSLLVPVRLFL